MFARRESTPERVASIAGGRPIINLGSSNLTLPGIWNEAAVVEPLLTPVASRELFGFLMPTNRWVSEGFYWLKGAGRGGANKEKLYITTVFSHDEAVSRTAWSNGDIQLNIVGQEYRVITVGTKVIQVTKRSGTNGNRDYEWVGVSAADSRVKRIARDAAGLLDNEKTIIGWDVIQSMYNGMPYILEGNSCPGVNASTASRILDAVEGVSYDG
jgi:hypothetical protein